jgi:hypothetical protein
MLHGDSNTKYFQLVANGKRRKTIIFKLEQEEGMIEGEDNLKKYITDFYKILFGKPKKNNFSLVESMNGDIPQVSTKENEALTTSSQKRK